jgi:hypothetical protein
MKNILSLSFIIFALAGLFVSCKTNSSESNIAAPEGMHSLDLARFGKPFSIFVPDTVKTRLTIIEQSNGALDIIAGTNFGVSINEQSNDLELLKNDLKDDEVNKLKSLIVDEPNALLWESEIVQPEFHFVLNKTVNGTEYSFEDIKDTEAEPFKKEAIQKMFDVCKNIQALKQ